MEHWSIHSKLRHSYSTCDKQDDFADDRLSHTLCKQSGVTQWDQTDETVCLVKGQVIAYETGTGFILKAKLNAPLPHSWLVCMSKQHGLKISNSFKKQRDTVLTVVFI